MHYSNLIASAFAIVGFATAPVFADCYPARGAIAIPDTDKYFMAPSFACSRPGDARLWPLDQNHMNDLVEAFKTARAYAKDDATKMSGCIAMHKFLWSAEVTLELEQGWTMYDIGDVNTNSIIRTFVNVRRDAGNPQKFTTYIYRNGDDPNVKWVGSITFQGNDYDLSGCKSVGGNS